VGHFMTVGWFPPFHGGHPMGGYSSRVAWKTAKGASSCFLTYTHSGGRREVIRVETNDELEQKFGTSSVLGE
jgi:hypothetical protein